MKNYGFIRVAAAVPNIRIADAGHNTDEICRIVSEAAGKGVSLLTFPELSVTGYSCSDIFMQHRLLRNAEEGIRKIIEFSRGKSITIVVGTPVAYRSRLYN